MGFVSVGFVEKRMGLLPIRSSSPRTLSIRRMFLAESTPDWINDPTGVERGSVYAYVLFESAWLMCMCKAHITSGLIVRTTH